MTLPRIYQNIDFKLKDVFELDDQASHYLAHVLRVRPGDDLYLFNQQGREYLARIEKIDKKKIFVLTKEFIARTAESPLTIHLAQGISRGEKMDFTIQKAVELGVNIITPLMTDRVNVKLNPEKIAKKIRHWQSVIISACEQSGRNQIPMLQEANSLKNFVTSVKADWKLILTPFAKQKLTEFPIKNSDQVILLIGPEGGLTPEEIDLAMQYHFKAINLGPRILRTETAGLAAISALQCYAGDM